MFERSVRTSSVVMKMSKMWLTADRSQYGPFLPENCPPELKDDLAEWDTIRAGLRAQGLNTTALWSDLMCMKHDGNERERQLSVDVLAALKEMSE